jgi:hypothetical protein
MRLDMVLSLMSTIFTYGVVTFMFAIPIQRN